MPITAILCDESTQEVERGLQVHCVDLSSHEEQLKLLHSSPSAVDNLSAVIWEASPQLSLHEVHQKAEQFYSTLTSIAEFI